MKKVLPVLAVLLVFLVLSGCLSEGAGKTVPANTAAAVITTGRQETTVPETSTVQTTETTTAPVETETVQLIETTIEETTTSEPATEPPVETTLATEAIPVRTADSTFEIYFLDVGQGDAACVICDGAVMLIDGGNKSNSSLIYSFLKSHNIQHLDYIVATHPDADHVGGLAGALNYATAGTAFCTVSSYDSEPFQDFIKYLGYRDCEVSVPNSGDSFYLGCAAVTIVYPDSGVTKTDNTSIALRIEYGDTSFFFAGDCENDDEIAILRSGYDLGSDVLKVAHHGSKYSSTSSFINAVNPTYAVISVGGNNTYGHPTEDVLSRLQGKGVTLFRTDIQGDVHCTSDGSKITFDVEKNADFDTYLAAGGYQNYLEELAAQETEPVDRTIPGEDDPDETEARVTYIANTNTKKFHYPSCSSVDQMKESNKWYFTGTRDELIELGYDPCGRCHP